MDESEEKEVETTEETEAEEQPDNLESRLKALEKENEALKNQSQTATTEEQAQA